MVTIAQKIRNIFPIGGKCVVIKCKKRTIVGDCKTNEYNTCEDYTNLEKQYEDEE